MENKSEVVNFLKGVRLFQDYDYAYDISHQLTKYIKLVCDSENHEDFVILLNGLDDNTGLFEFTQIIIENIQDFYFNRDKRKFLKTFLDNVDIIYPHAIEMTKNVLNPILNEARVLEIVCELLDNVSEKKKVIFREIYFQMLHENSCFHSICIYSKLTQMS